MTREQDTAKKMISVLDYGTQELDSATATKLAAARRQAIAALAQPAHATHAEISLAGMGRFLADHMHGERSWMPMALTLAVALLALVVVQHYNSGERIGTDASLLASDLPPEAYVDKGFDAWLETSSR